jgi:hypothetical protein
MTTLAYASSYAGSTNHRAIELAERLSAIAYPSINVDRRPLNASYRPSLRAPTFFASTLTAGPRSS